MEACFIWYLLLAVCLPLVSSSNKDCGKEKFPCDTGNQCVNRSEWCDNKEDCKDGSDETYCKKTRWYTSFDPNDCFEKQKTHVLCESGICIPIAAQCDELKDCEDGFDEKYCEPTEHQLNNVTPESATSLFSVDPPLWEDKNENKDATDITTTSVPDTPSLTSKATRRYKEDEEITTTTTSTTQEVYSSRINGYFPTSTSFYEKRMKEAGFDTKPLPTFPKTVPTVPYVITRSAVSSTPQTYRTYLTRPASSTTPHPVRRPPIPANLSRPQSTRPPIYNSRQRQAVNQPTNPYQPSINHYQLPTYPHQPPPNRYQPPTYPRQPPYNRYQPPTYPQRPPSNRHQSPTYPHQSPSNQYQPPTYPHQPHSNDYQPPTIPLQPSSNRYQPSTHHHQSPSSQYQPSTYHHQPPSNRYQPHAEHQIPPTYINNNEHQPLNGEPRYQSNYFKPYNSELGVKKFFFFAEDYASTYGKDNARSVREGREWLLRQRSDTGDWGRDTPRAVIALALSNNSFSKGDNETEVIKKRFLVRLGADLLKNNTENFNINRLAMAMNGLLAVCEDPTNFHGMDLTEMLRYKIKESIKRNSYLSPFVLLSLCLSNKSLSSSELQSLMKQMAHSGNANERAKDMQSAAILAFSCYVHQSTSEDSNYRISLRSTLRNAVANLLERVGEDGSFGSVYSTALAAQALMSTNESSNWNADKTMNFLKEQQNEDGSFGDLLATYFVLPVLSGRSLLHLRNIQKHCNPAKRELTPSEITEFAGPKQYVHYSLYFGYPLVNSLSLYLLVPRGINFLDVMRLAEFQDQSFRFALEDNSSKVYSLSGLPNDPEMSLSWHLYVKPESSPYVHEPNSMEIFSGDVRSLSPKSDDHLIFWYHSNDLRI